ncbi:MAG TPA: 3-hydroxyacyl-CoA dehydrogenase/enoyl-CoA hydratase family protein, partial [Chthonomonadales bacterium]|nr:3-hydroxyacyl-CoA dehydrogenase/enoyl-CoA hydratase family protein [Chthonomonadales bacterium]
EDDLELLAGADWVVEAVVEKLDIKQGILNAVSVAVGPQTVVTTNTSGLSPAEAAARTPAGFQARFFGTHFFNPPRYMKLLEIVPTPATCPDEISGFVEFAQRVLGKRVVVARDTPGFIANRLGVFSMLRTVHAALEHGLTVEQVDALTGPLIGRPRSGTFRLSDICGLDITADVAANLSARLPQDRFSQFLRLPPQLTNLLEDGRVGQKAGAGFYKRHSGGTIEALDWRTMDYRPRDPDSVPALRSLQTLPLEQRLKALIERDDSFGRFLWASLRDTLCYAAEVGPEIADGIGAIDDACKWGFNWRVGPFELWDRLGVEKTAKRLIEENIPIPGLVQSLLGHGRETFYAREGQKLFMADLSDPQLQVEHKRGSEYLRLDEPGSRVIRSTSDATLHDIGDGVYCLEFHTKMNVLGPGVVEMVDWSRQETEKNGLALVIGNHGEHFSAGFNLQLILMSAYSGETGEMLEMTRQIQETLLRLKRSTVPVIAAVHGYTLGGGCELALHCSGVQASLESYMGLPECGIGLIPAAGGTTEMLVRAMGACSRDAADMYPFVHSVFQTVGMAKVSGSAPGAAELGYLRPSDGVAPNPDRLLFEAKEQALLSATCSFQPAQPEGVRVMGEGGLAQFEAELHNLERSRFISEHDALVGRELANVLCGGSLSHEQTVSEEYLLGLEREAFVRLATTAKTQARIKSMLETGKPLRN